LKQKDTIINDIKYINYTYVIYSGRIDQLLYRREGDKVIIRPRYALVGRRAVELRAEIRSRSAIRLLYACVVQERRKKKKTEGGGIIPDCRGQRV
jgi:hypothetical protein